MKDKPIFSELELQGALESMRARPALVPMPLRSMPCSDCAVDCGLYMVYSEALKLATKEEQLFHSKRWFCHATTGLACRGNANNLAISWTDV